MKCVTAVFSGNKKRPVDMQTNNNVELLQKLWDIVGVGILMFSSKLISLINVFKWYSRKTLD